MLKFADSEAGKAINSVVEELVKVNERKIEQMPEEQIAASADGLTIRIVLPVSNGRLCAHFGHCESFALMDVDEKEKKIRKSALLPSPGHQPGVLPHWLKEKGANVIITGGMGARAVELFNSHAIKVIMGAPEEIPERIVQTYLDGTLVLGGNVCDH